jgi:glucoamylase
MAFNPAPAVGDQHQSWTSGGKDLVTTSLTGRVWATVGRGIVNEVFWPAVDQPQVKDLGFLVRVGDDAGAQWREVKAVGDYTISAENRSDVPLATVTHTGDFYRLSLRALPDPDHDALLLRYSLTGTGDSPSQPLTLYPLLAPHLGRCTAAGGDRIGADNTAWAEDGALYARDGTGDHFLCLGAASGFARTSVGYVGDSDGWTDLQAHQAMTWEYSEAGPGVVALMGELPAPEGTLTGTLAFGFGPTQADAKSAMQSALTAGPDAVEAAVRAQWQNRAATLVFPTEADGLSADVVDAVKQSATVLHMCEDHTTTGGIVAGLCTPWGDQTNDCFGYHMVWCRDSCETALALAALGDRETGARLLQFLAERQENDGSWNRCYFLDGSSLVDLQLDQIAFPVLLAAKLAELGANMPAGTSDLVRRAASYLVRNGPINGDDRWEETAGASPFTLGLIVVALVAAAQSMTGEEQAYVLSLADNWNERLEEFTYVSGGVVDRAFGTAGHYVRIGPPAHEVRLGNQIRSDATVPAELMVGMEFLYLPRLGLREPTDQRIIDTLHVIEQMLTRDTPSGQAFCRYDLDGYGEWIDGSGWPIRHFGVGRPWPLLVGERGHYDALIGKDVSARLDAMLAMRGRGGLMPEQIWDAGDLPWRQLNYGKPTGSAMPLAWAHSELVKLAITASTGNSRPVERLQVVDVRYAHRQPKTSTWHWRSTMPITQLPAECSISVEDTTPFTLHYGFDGWQIGTIAELPAERWPFAMYGVTLTSDQLLHHTSLQFTRRWNDTSWEGEDHAVALGAPRPQTRALKLPAREFAGQLPYPTVNAGDNVG